MSRNKVCGKCGGIKKNQRFKYAYCNLCHNKYQRDNRKKHSELSYEQKRKANARAYANSYLNRGKIKKQPCEICGDKNVQMHHDDYSKPLEIKWLCVKHHLEHHALLNSEAVEKGIKF